MMKLAFGLALALGLSIFSTAATANCNGMPGACKVANGTYHIVTPPVHGDKLPAVMFLHGYGGDGVGSMSNTGMVNVLLQRGYAVIAPDGEPLEGETGLTWDFIPNQPARRDETAFLVAVADDAAARFGLDRDKIILAGFSIGGSMTSYVACGAPKAFAAYAPISGSFWRPHPKSCSGPVRLLHTHGSADRTVPMVGRQIAPGIVQGNVLEAMEIWRATDKCQEKQPTFIQGIYTVQRWSKCAGDSQLEFAMHAGGHTIPQGWTQMMLYWFEHR